jgi:glycosyltransferase involved in cell wall biosynthesis
MNHVLPQVTILMPFKDPSLAFFREALNSVLSQSSTLWNLIVIYDLDKNTGAMNIIEELSHSKDDRISVLQNESNLLTGALNTGMRHANTPYVCSLLCDDLLDKNAIEVLCENIKRFTDIDFFHSSRMYIDERGKPISSVYRARDKFDLSDFENTGPVKHLLCWKRASAIAIGGMDESLGLHGADDYDFPWCMAEAGYSFKAIPECLYYYRDHRAHYRLTTHVPLETQIEELTRIWRKHGLTEKEIEEQIKIRTSAYLKQALYLDDQDKKKKESENYDIRRGWREKYR